MSERLPVGQALGAAWQLVKDNLPVVLGLSIVSSIFSFAPNPWEGSMNQADGNLGAYFGFSLVASIINLIVSVGVVRIYLRLIDGQKEGVFSAFFAPFGVYLSLIGATILTALVVGLGLIALIIPGIYFAVLYSLATNFIIDKQVGALEGMKMSAAAVKGNMWYLIGAGLLSILVAVAGILALGVGILVTLPIAQLAMLLIYRSLAARANGTSVEAAPAPAAA